jgi:hypothetical protein
MPLFGGELSGNGDEEDCVLREDFFEVKEDRLSQDCFRNLRA